MKQYLDKHQTAKLIELGFEKPSSISGYCQRAPYEYDAETNTKIIVYDDTQYPIYAYSIGELLSFLPPIIPQEYGYYINITHDSVSWVIDYKQYGDAQYKYIVSDVELIDALFDMIVKLKEMGVI